MRLLELDIQRMPGFERRGFAYQGLKKGINVICGPNGSGKTTTSSAIRALLWPRENDNLHPLLLRSLWEWKGTQLEILRESSKSTIPATLAEVLSSVSPQTYILVLDDLFNSQDKDLARIVAEEMRGGYDLEPLREQYNVPVRLGQEEAKKIGTIKIKYEEIAREQAYLLEQEIGTTKLKQQIELAEKASKQLEQVRHAIEGQNLRSSIDHEKVQLCAFPPGIQEVREEDEQELEAILQTLPKVELYEIDADVFEKARRMASNVYDDLQSIEAKLEGRKEEIEGLQQAFSEHARALGVTVEELSEKLIHELRPLGELSDKTIEEGKDYLEEWLSLEKNQSLVFSLGLSLGSVVLFFILLLLEQKTVPTALSAVIALFSIFPSLKHFIDRKKLVERYERLSLPQPKKWEKQEIVLIVKELEEMQESSVDQRLWFDEIKQARGTFIDLQKKEGAYQALRKEWDNALEDFYRPIPAIYQSCTPKEALMSLHEAIENHKLHLRKRNILARTQCTSRDPLTELREKKRMLEQFKDKEQKKIRLEGRLEQVLLKLNDRALLDLPLDDLKVKEQELDLLSSSLEALQAEAVKIAQDVNQELAQKRFSEISKQQLIATQEFEKKQNLWQENFLAQYLLREAEEQFEKQQRPEVLRVASGYFERFTMGSFSIDTVTRSDSGHQFRIYDHIQERHLSIEALSRGTALQLLLSIRLGYLSIHEQEGIKLPLILDEVLSHVDDDRFLCIADALLEIAEERQVFLFTCQNTTQHAWEKMSRDRGSSLIHVFDLEEIQKGCRRQRAPIFLPEKREMISPPEDEKSIVEYAAKLGLAGLDAKLQASEQSVWLVLSAPQQLFQALTLGLKTVGQLKMLLRLQPQLVSDAATIQGNIDLLQRFLQVIKIGNPPCVWRDDLEKAVKLDVFSATFLDAVDVCAVKAERRADRLLEMLKEKSVKRFKYVEPLEEFFLREGLLDQRKSLTEEEIRSNLWNHALTLTPEAALYINSLISLFVANKSADVSSIVLSS